MITLTIIFGLYVILGWIYRYVEAKKDPYYYINPFESSPTVFSFTLVMSTVIFISIIMILILRYCP